MNRIIVQRGNMINNDDHVVYRQGHLEPGTLLREGFSSLMVVLSRPIYPFEKIDTNYCGPLQDEMVTDDTRIVDALHRIRERLDKYPGTLQSILTNFVAYNYYDCMSGGCPTYDLSVVRQIALIHEFDRTVKIYPSMEGDDDEWYTWEAFFEHTKDVPKVFLPEEVLEILQLKQLGVSPVAD